MNNPYESFYHGLVASKLWLCEELEKTLNTEGIKTPTVNVLGGWHNVMSFMMIVRDPYRYKEFHSYDKDEQSTGVANQICDTWRFEEPRVYNHTENVSLMDFSNCQNTVFINCSVDQFEDTKWFSTIPSMSLVCMQTTDIIDENPQWEINQRTKDLTEFRQKYNLHSVLYAGSKEIKYGDKVFYNRLMLIGYK